MKPRPPEPQNPENLKPMKINLSLNLWSTTFLAFIGYLTFSLSKDINTPRKCVGEIITYTDVWMIVILFIIIYTYGYLAGRTDTKKQINPGNKS